MTCGYFCYHLHSDCSNQLGTTDSVTPYTAYIERAKKLGMTALAFSEHGNVRSWKEKMKAVQAAGMRYVHAVEAYLTMTLLPVVRDNYHVVLIARNSDGLKKLNRMVEASWDEKHFFLVPRIPLAEIDEAGEDILLTTACMSGPLNTTDQADLDTFLAFLKRNRQRTYLEIQHHPDRYQAAYNRSLADLSVKLGIPLIAGTDTHALDREDNERRKTRQMADNGVHCSRVDTFQPYLLDDEQLCEAYRKQGSLHEEIWRGAMNNTLMLLDRIQPYETEVIE